MCLNNLKKREVLRKHSLHGENNGEYNCLGFIEADGNERCHTTNTPSAFMLLLTHFVCEWNSVIKPK